MVLTQTFDLISELTFTFTFETLGTTNVHEVNNNTTYLMPIREIEVADIINSVCEKNHQAQMMCHVV